MNSEQNTGSNSIRVNALIAKSQCTALIAKSQCIIFCPLTLHYRAASARWRNRGFELETSCFFEWIGGAMHATLATLRKFLRVAGGVVPYHLPLLVSREQRVNALIAKSQCIIFCILTLHYRAASARWRIDWIGASSCKPRVFSIGSGLRAGNLVFS